MRPTTRRTLDASMRHRLQPVTRDTRPRQLPTVSSHAVPTGECQSDPPSLLRALRCSRSRANPPSRAGPLDVLLHVIQFVHGACGRVAASTPRADRGAHTRHRPRAGAAHRARPALLPHRSAPRRADRRPTLRARGGVLRRASLLRGLHGRRERARSLVRGRQRLPEVRRTVSTLLACRCSASCFVGPGPEVRRGTGCA